MKKKTRMIALVLVLALSLAMLPQMALTAHAAIYSGNCGAEGDNLTWTLDADLGVLTIEGSGEMENYYWNEAPWDFDNELIKTVILPEGLTSIGTSAFYCCAMTDVTIPDTVTEIGAWAFWGAAFTELTIPDSVTKIGEYAFGCSNLTSVSIPASVTEIGDAAFTDCDSLAVIHVASDNPAYCSLDGVLFNKARTVLLQYAIAKPDTVYAIPEGVETVAERAFMQNYNLTAIIVSSSVEDLSNYPFSICYGLTDVQVVSENEHYSSLDGVLFNKSRTELLMYPMAKTNVAYTVPDGVQCIKSCAFSGENLQNVVIPNSVMTIGSAAFQGCTALSSITLPDSIERIGSGAFYETAYFEDENNWDGRLLYLGQWLLAARSEILTADIREGTVGIADETFYNCVSLQSVSIPDSITVIGDYTFAGDCSLANVTMGNGVTEIGESAFIECTSLKSLTLSTNLTSIGARAFKECSALQSITIPEGVTVIREETFDNCSELTSVDIPTTVTEIGAEAFCNCPKLMSVVIPASVTEIGNWAFGYWWGFERFTIYGEEGSAAQCYAEENGFRFVSLQASSPFEDVKPSDFFFNPVLWAVENGVTGGIDETHFAPEQTVMRADAMVFFWAANQRPAFTDSSKTFKDVKKKHWAYNAVMWAVENGITGGTDAEGNYFSPQRTCSRSEILQFLYAAMGKPEYTIDNPYSDVKTKHWYYDGAIWAYEKGLEKGENGKFKAKTPCTRGYVVTYLYRYMTGLELAE